MKYQITLIGLLILTIPSLFSFVKHDVFHCTKQSTPLVMGLFDENWHSDLQKDYSSGIAYGLTNDKLFLYVRLKTEDVQQSRMIILNGVHLHIKSNNKPKSHWELEFPVSFNMSSILRTNESADRNHPPQDKNKLSRRDISAFNNHFLTGMAMMQVSGDQNNPEPLLVYNRLENGLEGILRMDSTQTLFYEVKVPLAMIFPHPESFLDGSDTDFSFEFLIEGTKRTEGSDNMRPEGRGQKNGQRSSNQMGSRQGPPDQNKSRNNQPPNTESNIKIKVKRALLAPCI